MKLKVVQPAAGVSEAHLIFKSVCCNPQDAKDYKHFFIRSEVHEIVHDQRVPPASIVINKVTRSTLNLAFGDVADCEPFDASSTPLMKLVTFSADYLVRTKVNNPIVASVVKSVAKKYLSQLVLTVGQKFALPTTSLDMGTLLVEVVEIDGSNVPLTRGRMPEDCFMSVVKNPASGVLIVGEEKSAKTKRKIMKDGVNLMTMGIGGMSEQFAEIFRAAFASRMYSPAFLAKVGRKHVKGLILYGPPGTGKTLLARQIGEMLDVASVTAIAGPELLNSYIGKTEENVRNLFANALADTKKLGEESPLHLIIFDEIDAICRKRGGSASTSSQINDSVVNQLLSMMDGVTQLNNIFIVAMTNRIDLLDDALLRPGRFELKIQVSLPDEKGRLEILQIHTRNMRSTGLMDSQVDLSKLAAKAKNFSGAELEGLVKEASSHALLRGISTSEQGEISVNEDAVFVTPTDCELALAKIKPLFGSEEAILHNFVPYGVVSYGRDCDLIFDKFQKLLKVIDFGSKRNSVAVMIEGPVGSGKTAMASHFATNFAKFPFVKVVSPDILAGCNANEKHAEISRIFHNAHRSPKSIIILDDIEGLIDYVELGGIQFSNQVLQCIISFIRKPPPPESKLLVIATCSNWDILKRLGLEKAIQEHISLRYLTTAEILKVLENTKALKNREDALTFVEFAADLFGSDLVPLKLALFEAEKFNAAKNI